MRNCWLDLDCLRIAMLSLAHQQGRVFGGNGVGCTDQVALPDDESGCSFALVE